MNKIAVLGMGKSGQSAAKLALSRDMEVHCLDSNQNATRIQGSQFSWGKPQTSSGQININRKNI